MKLNFDKMLLLLRWLCCYLHVRAAGNKDVRRPLPRLLFIGAGIDQSIIQSSAVSDGLPVWYKADDKLEHLQAAAGNDSRLVFMIGSIRYEYGLQECLERPESREALYNVLSQANSLRLMQEQ